MNPTEDRLKKCLAAIEAVSPAIAEAAQRIMDGKTKPRGSLGRLEELACQLCAVQGTTEPQITSKAIVVMAGDHGVAVEGVSAFPQEVTSQMLLNFASGGAAINVLAKEAGARLVVVDMGVKTAVEAENVRKVRIAPGTQNMRNAPAMTRDQALDSLIAGIEIGEELARDGVSMVGIGEMGIANTTASSAITSVLTGLHPEHLTGHGTGIDETARRRKMQVIEDAIAFNQPDPSDALDVLRCLGGFEIAGLAGVVLGAASKRVLVIVDGFISSVAALVAARLQPTVCDYLVASHMSVEPGHQALLHALKAPPLLDLSMRLGEGTGTALAMQLVSASHAILRDMASFESAGVSKKGQ